MTYRSRPTLSLSVMIMLCPCFMVFPSKNDDKIKIIVNGFELCKVTECKYLGVTLDHELRWAAHIEQLYKKLV
jgi:hypothetical protein